MASQVTFAFAARRGAPRATVIVVIAIGAALALAPSNASATHYIRTQAEVQLSGCSNFQSDYVASSDASCSGAWDDPDGSRHSTYSGTASGTAAYASVSASATADQTTIWLGSSGSAHSDGWFWDTITVTGGTPGDLGTFSMPIVMTGAYSVVLGSRDYTSWDVTFFDLTQIGGVGYTLSDSANLSQSATVTWHFRFGQPLTLYGHVGVRAVCGSEYSALEEHHTSVQISASILGFTNVRDVDGNPVASYAINSESGTVYGEPLSEQPTSWGSVKSLFR